MNNYDLKKAKCPKCGATPTIPTLNEAILENKSIICHWCNYVYKIKGE